MALRSEEIDRIKYELGAPMTRVGAEPYITFVAIFDRVIQPYLFDNSTTSSTSVVAGATQAITLAANPISASGIGLTFQVGTLCLVDMGPTQEQAVIQAVSGLSVTLTFASAHGSVVPYPVAPVGSEQIIRDILTRLDTIRIQLQTIAPNASGVESVDDIRLFPSGSGKRGKVLDKAQALVMQRDIARDDLGDALGCPNFRRAKRGGATSFEVY